MRRRVILEPEAVEVSNQSAIPPRIYQLPPEKGREVLEKAQDSPVFKYPAQIDTMMFHTGEWGKIPLFVVKPEGRCTDNVIFYIHGAGWVFGSFQDRKSVV